MRFNFTLAEFDEKVSGVGGEAFKLKAGGLKMKSVPTLRSGVRPPTPKY